MPGFAVDSHPEKDKIIEQIMAGKPTRSIGSSVVPPIPHSAVQRYKSSVIIPMIRRAEASQHILKGKSLISTEVKVDPEAPQAVQAVQQAIRDAPGVSIFRRRLEHLHGRIDHALTRAETAVRAAPDPESGDMVAVGIDLAPLAPLFNQAHKNLEMLGRATGELEPVGQGSVSIQIVCPSAGSPAGELPRVSFAAVDQIEAADEDEVSEIGLLQKP